MREVFCLHAGAGGKAPFALARRAQMKLFHLRSEAAETAG
jgi:hypothetical protein